MSAVIIRLRSALLVYLTHNMALPVLKLIRKPERFPYTIENLKQLPDKSLGKELALFLEKRKLPLLPYYARHDIKHVLLEYDTTDVGEVCLQCFMLGNRHISFPVMATVLYGFITMPEHWRAFSSSFRRGRASIPVSEWQWFMILSEPLQSLRKKINGKNENHY